VYAQLAGRDCFLWYRFTVGIDQANVTEAQFNDAGFDFLAVTNDDSHQVIRENYFVGSPADVVHVE